jgi:hypothetical protein
VIEDLAAPASVGRGGHAMYVLQWLRALSSLGDEVYLLEFLKEPPDGNALRYFKEIVNTWWRPDRSALVLENTGECIYGLDARELKLLVAEAAAVITLAAHYSREFFPIVDKIRPRILIEQDPGYTHLWVGDDPRDIFGEHDIYFTVGGNIGTDRCNLPTHGIDWKHIWNPVVLDWWSAPMHGAPGNLPFTTIGDWRSYGYLEFEGKLLGPKAEEFRKFINLPRDANEQMQMILQIDSDDPDVRMLEEHGWQIELPATVATPDLYRSFIQNSAAEFSCVKGGYAGTNCGWFSDRSACYLAAGKPVIMQSTGFEDLLSTGQGIFAVESVEGALSAITEIRNAPDKHSQSAFSLAKTEFDSSVIGATVLREIS